MLNELATLRASLERHNIEYRGRSPWVKRMAKSPTLVAGLPATLPGEAVRREQRGP